MTTTPALIPLLPAVLMGMGALLSSRFSAITRPWRVFMPLSALAFAASLYSAWPHARLPADLSWLALTPLGGLLAALVQLLGTVIGAFSARYLEGEDGQKRYAAALAGMLASVHLLLLANHWLVLIAAWSVIGAALQHLLCFYGDRPFARLAAHKKRLADRLADALLLAAAILAWHATGSGSLSDLARHIAAHGAGPALQCSAVCLALAVILRTALLPVHGWLIQVMEAPTPVSALLHAGVVNLGGFVLIRFAALLDHAPAARWLLAAMGLITAVLAGLVMLTRITIKVRLAWSTVAQMGFMVLECGLGLYTFAALHLLGHSLYKAHHFLSASGAVRQTRLQMLQDPAPVHPASLLLAPMAAAAVLGTLRGAGIGADWPWWWTVSLALAWAPLLWLPRQGTVGAALRRAAAGLILIAGLGGAASLTHLLPLGLHDAPQAASGWLALSGLAALYGCLALLQWRARALATWRGWSYAGFYTDEYYTRLTLLLWPTPWTAAAKPAAPSPATWNAGASAANVY